MVPRVDQGGGVAGGGEPAAWGADMFKTRCGRWSAVALVVAALMIGACSSRTPFPRTASTNDISVAFTSWGGGGACVPSWEAINSGTLTYSRHQDANMFTIALHLSEQLCHPIEATAVVYVMPGEGLSWPQTLAGSKPLTLQEPGSTVVHFTKGCDPAQFEVVTGEVPPIIQPTNAPALLFPGNIDTALQWWGGNDCPPSSTTTSSTTTSTSTTTTSTSTTTTTIPEPGVPLHNDTAGPQGDDCPTDGQYWHFVLVPNNNTSSFTSVTLVLAGDIFTFTGDDLIPNAGQTDNIFIKVPDGYSLTDLEAEGSYADYLGRTPISFNLSGVCA
jgi:hypothetical protein